MTKIPDATMVPLFPEGTYVLFERHENYADGMHVLVESQNNNAEFLRQYLVDGEHQMLKSLKLGANWNESLTEVHILLGAVIEVRYHMR